MNEEYEQKMITIKQYIMDIRVSDIEDLLSVVTCQL